LAAPEARVVRAGEIIEVGCCARGFRHHALRTLPATFPSRKAMKFTRPRRVTALAG
jgi:hypothetical protein